MMNQHNNDDDNDVAARMKMKITLLPDPPPFPATNVEGKAGASPRRRRQNQMSQWLHDRQHRQHYTIDTTPQVSSMPPPLLDKTANENPSPPLQKQQQQQQQQQQSKPQSHPHRAEQHQHRQEGQAQQQRDASAFMTAFLRGAASGHHGDDEKISLTVPTKIGDHDSRGGGEKKSSNKQRKTKRFVRKNTYGSERSEESGKINQLSCSGVDELSECLSDAEVVIKKIYSGNEQPKTKRFVRKNTYGSATNDDDNISRASSMDIENFSECLNEVVRSTTKREDNSTCEITTIKTKKSGEQKKGSRRLRAASSPSGGESEDDMSVVSNLSDWNELLEKTFGPNDSHSHSREEHGIFDPSNYKHVEHVGEGKGMRPCDEGTTLERSSSDRLAPTYAPCRLTASHNASTPTATPPHPPKPILKVKDYDMTKAYTERLTSDHTLIDKLIAIELDESIKTSCSDTQEWQYYTKQRKFPRVRPSSSSMDNIFDMMENMFCDDTRVEHHSFEAEQQKVFASLRERADANERARIDRLREKKAAVHTKALRDSVEGKPPGCASPHEPRPRTNSFDDADRFLRSLEQARALNKVKVEKNSTTDLGGSLNPSGSSSNPVHRVRGDVETKSFSAFDEMLAEIEDEERRMEASLFGSKPKSTQREYLSKKQNEGGVLSSRSSEHSGASFTTNSTAAKNFARNTTKVICLKWVDRRGMVGHFTGEVNELIQPHGKGILVYQNGLVLDCHWCNGTPTVGMTDDIEVAANTHSVTSRNRSNQIHPDYDLGMTVRSPRDMKDEEQEKAMEGISRLKKLDFAFVRRSNEQWTYSIISDRTDDSIRFVVDELGRTKKINRDGWLKNIRRIRVHKHKHRDRGDDEDDHSYHQQQMNSRHHRRHSHSTSRARKKLEP